MAVPQPIDEQIIVSLRAISQAIDTYSRFLWREYALTAPQLGALRELIREPQTPARLAERMHLSPQTMTGIVSRLLERKLVSRTPDERDRRSYSLTITPEGRQLADAAPSLLRDRFRTELANLQPWEQTQMLATLQRIAAMMSAETESSEPFLYTEQPSASEGGA